MQSRGSSAISDAFGSQLAISASKGHIHVVHTRNLWGPEHEPIKLRLVDIPTNYGVGVKVEAFTAEVAKQTEASTKEAIRLLAQAVAETIHAFTTFQKEGVHGGNHLRRLLRDRGVEFRNGDDERARELLGPAVVNMGTDHRPRWWMREDAPAVEKKPSKAEQDAAGRVKLAHEDADALASVPEAERETWTEARGWSPARRKRALAVLSERSPRVAVTSAATTETTVEPIQ